MPKFLDYIINLFKRNNIKRLNTTDIKFQDEKLQNYLIKKVKKEEITTEDLALIKNITYSGNGEKVLQDDIDKIIKYCDLSDGQLYLDNLDITGISFENLKVKDLMLKRTKLGENVFPPKDILKTLGVENSVGIKFDDFNEYELETFYVSEMNVVDLEIAKRFKNTLTRLSIFDNPLDNLEGIEDFPKLKELSVAFTNIDLDSKEEILKLREKGIKIELLGTPLEQEINKMYKEKQEEEEKKRQQEEGLIVIDEKVLKYINNTGILGQVDENRKITKKDIERLNIRNKEEDIDLKIPSEYGEEFLKINEETNVDLRKLSIDIGKGDYNFNIEEFLKRRNNSSLVELQIETPSSIESQPQEYLSTRYGITYNFDNEQYHYDEIKGFEKELNKMNSNFKNEQKNLDTVKNMYRYIRENIEWKEQKILDRQAVKTLSGEQVATVELKENMIPYRKLEYILKNHSTDYFGMRNLMYHMLLSLGYNADIEFENIEFDLPNKTKKSSNIDIEIGDNKYSLDLDNKEGMVIINNETRENEIIYPNRKIDEKNISIEDEEER